MALNIAEYLPTTIGTVLFVIIVIWSLYWKGMALWKSARDSEKWWFIALLLINTIGILEILYIYVFSKKKK
jgi:hypothetical protein